MPHIVVAILTLLASAAADPAPPRPNIILFLVDDYDKPETGVYGGKVLTPNLDRLAREGMLFHNAHVTSTVCTPSRYTFLTGRYAGSSTSKLYLAECPEGQQGLPGFNVGLEADNMNVARVLADAGYATGYVGKYHVHDADHHDDSASGLHPIEKNVEYSNRVNRLFFENEKLQRKLILERGFTWAKNIYWGNIKAPFKGHNPEWTMAAALEFVEQNRARPFYLHYCTTLLHGPNGEWYRSLTEKTLITGEGKIDKPVDLIRRESVMRRLRKAGLTENEAGYLWMDDTLGLLLDKLDELGIAENTIVVFVSDHGSERKGSLFKTRGTEIPCVVRWPKVIKSAQQSHELLQNTDFVPTWFEVAGADAPEKYRIDGVSLLPLFKDPKHSVRDYVYGEQGPARSIKTKKWNYITLRYSKAQIAELEGGRARGTKKLLGLSGGISRSVAHHPHAMDADQLYNLEDDPGEQKNMVDDPIFATELDSMIASMKTELRRFENRPYGEMIPGNDTTDRATSAKALEKLRAASEAPSKKKK